MGCRVIHKAMRRATFVGIAVFACVVAPAVKARDLNTITLDCVFEHQNTINITGGAPSKDDTPQKPLLTTITGLDAKAGRATMVGNLGSVPLAFFSNGVRWVFVQITDTGNATVTSMLDPSTSGEAYAVHSRHMWLLDKGIISQWAGTCKVR